MTQDDYIDDLREENSLIREALQIAIMALEDIAHDSLVEAQMYRRAHKALDKIESLKGE